MKPVTVPADAPPMFAAIAIDDEMFGRQGFALVESWHKANRPVELHAYERGGHGFGLGRPGTTTVELLDQFTAWLKLRAEPAAKP
jgi:acetyl esterase/lipase